MTQIFFICKICQNTKFSSNYENEVVRRSLFKLVWVFKLLVILFIKCIFYYYYELMMLQDVNLAAMISG